MKKRNELIELDVEAIGSQGISIARKEGLVYFVKGAVPGDKVIAQVRRKRKNHVECVLSDLLNPSPLRAEPKCDYFGVCGGCSWQHFNYSEQLKWKKQQVEDAFTRIAKIPFESIEETLASPKVYNYRNKMEFSFGNSRWLTTEEIESEQEIQNREFALGLHIPGRFDKVLDVKECQIQNSFGNEVLKIIRNKAIEHEVTAYDSRSHKGFLRNLIIRTSDANNEIMVILITNKIETENDSNFIKWYDDEFVKNNNRLSVIGRSINDTRSPVASEKPLILKGNNFIIENILGIDFQISPYSFFQTNSKQLNNFIAEIISGAGIQHENTVWDLYCGTGSITLPASRKCKQITGIEIFESSIADAKNNAKQNGIDNADFICADLHDKKIPDLLHTLEKPDVIIIDPPRAGIHANLLNHLLEVETPRIVYVSCNPATQARDCAVLSEKYDVKSLKPVDMFPHTSHVESIAVLEIRISE
ncbi:MAG: 23S rRNA (uracil(1939)-C(5))-methyltransferase RlmD [bacterium]